MSDTLKVCQLRVPIVWPNEGFLHIPSGQIARSSQCSLFSYLPPSHCSLLRPTLLPLSSQITALTRGGVLDSHFTGIWPDISARWQLEIFGAFILTHILLQIVGSSICVLRAWWSRDPPIGCQIFPRTPILFHLASCYSTGSITWSHVIASTNVP